jgi:hypothetical protein
MDEKTGARQGHSRLVNKFCHPSGKAPPTMEKG